MKKEESAAIKSEIINYCNVIYHNLRVARHSVNELNYLLNHPLDCALFPFAGFPHYYFANLIDIHGRNATTLLFGLMGGKLSIPKLINKCETNIDQLDYAIPKKEILALLENARKLIDEQKAKHMPLLSACRNKFACHQDKINAGPVKDVANIAFPLTDMLDLLPNLEQAFAYIYYPLTGDPYEQLPNASFIDIALHKIFDNKIEELEKND